MRVDTSLLSYDGALSFGISGDYDSAPDIDVLSAGIEDGLHQLVELADRSSTSTGPGAIDT